MREALGVLALVVAGILVYTACLMAFADIGPYKAVLLGVFAVPALLATLLGKWLRRIGWRHAFGLPLFWGGVSTLAMVICMACMWFTPQLQPLFAADPRVVGGYRQGLALLAGCLLLGGLCWRAGLRARAQHR
ncbi:MAG TPA: hypothetical protein DDZ67_14755 [Xanthomonadaceae bacterium]|nr:hypothetical protein [Xanthomonadaceae bacterium]